MIISTFAVVIRKPISSVLLKIQSWNLLYIFQSIFILTIHLFPCFYNSIVRWVLTIHILLLFQHFVKIVCQRKKKNQQKKELSQLNQTLNDVSIGSGTSVSVMENEISQHQVKGQHIDFEKFIDSASQNQVIESNIDDIIRRALDNAVSTVKNCMHDAILTAMVIPKVETVIRSISGSIGHGPNSEVRNSDRRNFLGNAGNTPLM